MKKLGFFIFIYFLCISAGKARADFRDYPDILQQTLPAVVFIANESNYFDEPFKTDNEGYFSEFLRPFYEWWWPPSYSHGSGFFVSQDGYIVTNAHVINGVTSVIIAIQNQKVRVCKASIVGKDFRTDIAVLKVENKENIPFPFLEFGDSEKAKVGDTVFAIGSPETHVCESSVTQGIISGKKRNNLGNVIEDFIQTDASINHGNSGGPLINTKGEVIGINTLGYSHYLGIESIGFAVPSNIAREIVKQLIAHGEISQGYLGVMFTSDIETAFDQYYFYEKKGAHIKQVHRRSPAARAGIQKGDVIIAINGNTVESGKGLINQLWSLPPFTKVDIRIDRNGEIIELKAELDVKHGDGF